jgi:hypothetical protein
MRRAVRVAMVRGCDGRLDVEWYRLELRGSRGRYKWYWQGSKFGAGFSSGVGASTVRGAMQALEDGWGGPRWDLRYRGRKKTRNGG